MNLHSFICIFGKIMYRDREVTNGHGLTLDKINKSHIPRWWDAIYISEDEGAIRRDLEVLYKKAGFKEVRSFPKNADLLSQVKRVSKSKRILFSIDIDDGSTNRKSGVIVATKIKEVSNDSNIVFLSSKLALMKKKDFEVSRADGKVAKSANTEQDVADVIVKAYNSISKEYHMSCDTLQEVSVGTRNDRDLNEFHRLISDREWLEKNEGKFMAIIDGILFGVDDDERRLISNVKKETDEALIEKITIDMGSYPPLEELIDHFVKLRK